MPSYQITQYKVQKQVACALSGSCPIFPLGSGVDLYVPCDVCDCLFPCIDVKPPGSGIASVSDSALCIDKIEAIREGGIGVVNVIAHLIDSHRKPEIQIQQTGFGGVCTV